MTLTACEGQKEIPTVIPSITPAPSVTITFTLTSEPTKILPTQPRPTQTLTPFPPYPTKQLVFDYYVFGNLNQYSLFFVHREYCCILTRLVLYDDGQMIIVGKSETYKQKVLSSDEINQFLLKLETLGFYSLESNQKHDPTDKLYDYGNNYQATAHGLKDCILVNADKQRNLCFYEHDKQFLIPKMKNILQYLDEYEPAGMIPYHPDRILLEIEENIDPAIDIPPAIPWDENFPSLDTDPRRYTTETSNQVIFIDGDLAKAIHKFFEGGEGWKVVSQNNKEYFIHLRTLLPHEEVKNPYQ